MTAPNGGKYGAEVLPLWVADMDFVSAEPIFRALHERVDHGFFGYTFPLDEFCQTIRLRLQATPPLGSSGRGPLLSPRFGDGPELCLPCLQRPGEGGLVQPPVYHHFMKDPAAQGGPSSTPRWSRRGIPMRSILTLLKRRSRPRPGCLSCAIPTTRSGGSYKRPNSKIWARFAFAETW